MHTASFDSIFAIVMRTNRRAFCSSIVCAPGFSYSRSLSVASRECHSCTNANGIVCILCWRSNKRCVAFHQNQLKAFWNWAGRVSLRLCQFNFISICSKWRRDESLKRHFSEWQSYWFYVWNIIRTYFFIAKMSIDCVRVSWKTVFVRWMYITRRTANQ